MRSFLLACLLLLLVPSISHAQSAESDSLVTVPVNISVWRDISISDMVMRDREGFESVHHLSLALPYGEGDFLRGIAVGLGGTTYKRSASGLQIGGIGNITAESFRGIQLNGLGGVIGESGLGMQLSGLAGIAGESFSGIQSSGLISIAGENVDGIQLAGLAAIGAERVQGFQSAGLAALSGEGMRGIQTAGFASISANEMRGIQVAGFASIAGEESAGIQIGGFTSIASQMSGLQLAGLANISGELAGVQFGVLNVVGELRGLQVGVVNVTTENPKGISLGLFTYVHEVPVNLEASIDETAGFLLGIQSGSEFFKNYVGLGARPFGPSETRWDAHAGFGVERPLSNSWYAGVDLITHVLIPEAFNSSVSTLIRLRAPISYRFSNGNALFVAPSVNLLLAGSESAAELAPYSFYEAGENHPRRGWLGLSAGLRLPIR